MLNVNALKQREFSNNEYRAVLPKEFGLTDILNKEFYRHVAGKVNAGDTIELVKEDYSEYFKLIIVGTPDKSQPQLWLNVKLLFHVVLTEQVEKEVGNLKIEKNIKDNKFKVTKADKTTLAEYNTQEDALGFAEDFLKE